KALFHQERAQVAQPACVAPLVVVPGGDFDEVAADDVGALAVDDAGAFVALHIHGDDGVQGEAEDALHLFGGVFADGGVDFVLCRVAFGEGDEFDDGDGGGGHAIGEPVKLAFDFGDDQFEGLGGAG